MRRYLLILAGLLSLGSTVAQAANSTVSAMTAASALGGTELLYVVQGAADRKGTPAQFATYIYGLASGDCTISSLGAVVCLKTNGVAFGALATVTPGTGVATALGVNIGSAGAFTTFGGAHGTPSSITLTNGTGLPIAGLSGLATGIATWLATPSSANLAAALTDETGSGAAVFGTAPTIASLNATVAMTLAYITGSTQCLQVNTSGVVSGTGAVCGGSGSSGANPTATAGPAAVNGVATTFMRSDGAPAVQKGTNAQFGIVEGDGSTITCVAGVCSTLGAGSGTVTSVSAGCGTSTGGSPITATGTVSAAITRRANATTTDTLISTDCGNIVSESNAASIAVAIAQAGTTGFANGTYFSVCNIGVGTATITPTTSTIGGASTYALPGGTAAAPKCVGIQSDGTNYNVVPDWFAVGALATITPGTGVATAAAANLSAAGGLTSTIFHGTLTIPSTAIGSQACGTTITVAATNVVTTDVVTAGFAADPTSTTGFLPTATLTIEPFPTAGNVNARVCNLTGSSITPTSTTINVSVVR